MNPSDESNRPRNAEDSLARLEQRLAKVERMLGLEPPPEPPAGIQTQEPKPAEAGTKDGVAPGVGEFEAVIGQNLFANIGIGVLAIGGALALSLPWQGVPGMVPSGCGWALAGVLLILAWSLHQSLPLIAKLCRAAGMALLFFATLRLCYFGTPPLLEPASMAAAACLSLAVAINLGIGWWRQSEVLTGLALVTGYAVALAVGTPGFVFGMVTAMSLVAVWALRQRDWPWLVVFATPCGFATYLLWSLGNPAVGHRVEVVAGPFAGVWLLLVWMVIHGAAMSWRRDRATEGPVVQVGSVVNCGGYVLFLLHTLIRYGEAFFAANAVASFVLLGLAVLYWVRERSRFATFVYAMTGYAALNMALINVAAVPQLFVWLSAQSLLVVITAIWFRSRFIIIANFLIYLLVVAAYMVLVLGKQESGISLVFVLVALTSARVLKWQKDRLELKTELMRNAYLTSAFIVFPYASYHIVPQAWVALSWVGIALFYYVMNLLTQARKYRWMGHNTLLLTVIYVLIVGVGRLEGTQRIVSFLGLGTVLLVVSLVFSVIRARQHRNALPPPANDDRGDGPAPS